MIKRIINKAKNYKTQIRKKYFPTVHEKRVGYFKKNTAKDLRLSYNINEESVVFDIGGYVGQWACEMSCKFNPIIYIFEPVPEYSDIIKNKFLKNPKIYSFNYGLSNKDTTSLITLQKTSSSSHKKSKNSIDINLKKISSFIKQKEIKKIDVMKINIEGEEYNLLNDLLDNNLISIIDNIQIQFHDFVPSAEEKMKSIQNKLSKTHKTTYQYPFVWENWELKQ